MTNIDICSQEHWVSLPDKRKDIVAIWDVTIFLEMWIMILLYKYEVYGYS